MCAVLLHARSWGPHARPSTASPRESLKTRTSKPTLSQHCHSLQAQGQGTALSEYTPRDSDDSLTSESRAQISKLPD